jgi:plasmid replication initiation protein
MKAQNINFRITMELVEILRLCLDSDKFEDNKSRVAALEDIYIAKEKLMAAKTIIEKWQSSSNEEVTIISKDYLSAIEELLISNSIDEKLFKKKICRS